jgi:hypothetical protein
MEIESIINLLINNKLTIIKDCEDTNQISISSFLYTFFIKEYSNNDNGYVFILYKIISNLSTGQQFSFLLSLSHFILLCVREVLEKLIQDKAFFQIVWSEIQMYFRISFIPVYTFLNYNNFKKLEKNGIFSILELFWIHGINHSVYLNKDSFTNKNNTLVKYGLLNMIFFIFYVSDYIGSLNEKFQKSYYTIPNAPNILESRNVLHLFIIGIINIWFYTADNISSYKFFLN